MREEWQTKTLGDVCNMIKRGIAPKYVDSGGVCVVNQKCIRSHNVNCGLARRHNLEAKKVPEERYVRVGDVLVNSTGTGTLGRVAQVRTDLPEPTTVDTHVTIVRPLDGLFYADFFGYMMVRIEGEIASSGEGTSGQTELSRTALSEKFSVSFPTSLQEQKRIVAILDEAFEGIDKAIANTEKNLANAKELFESHLNAVFSKKGEGWVTQALGEIADLVDSLHKTPTYIDEGGYPMVRVTDVKGGTLDLTNARRVDEETYHEFSKRHKSSIGDLVLSRVGSYGVPVVVETDEPFCLGQNTVFILPKINPHLLYYYLISPHAKSQIDGFVAGTTQPTISLKSIKSIAVPYPPQDDQETIVANLKSSSLQLETLLKVGRQKSSCLAELKQSILQKAFNGELTSHPDKELAKAGA